nr:hypothetical protein CFP56_71883 [Quercus suber]
MFCGQTSKDLCRPTAVTGHLGRGKVGRWCNRSGLDKQYLDAVYCFDSRGSFAFRHVSVAGDVTLVDMPIYLYQQAVILDAYPPLYAHRLTDDPGFPSRAAFSHPEIPNPSPRSFPPRNSVILRIGSAPLPVLAVLAVKLAITQLHYTTLCTTSASLPPSA